LERSLWIERIFDLGHLKKLFYYIVAEEGRFHGEIQQVPVHIYFKILLETIDDQSP